MSRSIPADLLSRWHSGQLVADARPVCHAKVRTGHFFRHHPDGSHQGFGKPWAATWTPTSDWIDLPNVAQFELEQSFDQNGIAVGTLDIENIEYVEKTGAGGALYHDIERGWYSPLRAYRAPGRPGPKKSANEWDRLLGIVSELRIEQGYGDATVRTYSGLIDSTTVSPLPDKLRLASRDFGAVLVDTDLFAYNLQPGIRDPLTFWDEKRCRALERSGDASKRFSGRNRRKKWMMTNDVADMLRIILPWAGFDPDDLDIHDTGARLKEPVAFAYTEHYSDIIQKACDLTGYQFWIAPPSDEHPHGRPTFRRSRAVISYPPITAELRDDKLLTGLSWQTTSEPKRARYRIRGKDTPADRGGVPLGNLRTPALWGQYRPPWHRADTDGEGGQLGDRDARLLKHAVHMEPLYKTQKEVDVAVQMWALASALAATTATLEIPTNPAITLDDVVSARDAASGVNTRCWVASRHETFVGGKEANWIQSLGVSCLDDPDVVEVVQDLHATLMGRPSRGLKH